MNIEKFLKSHQRLLIGLLLALIIIIIIISVSCASVFKNPPNIDSAKTIKNSSEKSCTDGICLTPACVRAASQILEYIDEEVDPCDDFYKFSCNNFIKNTQMSNKNISKNRLSMTNTKIRNDLITVMASPIEDNEIEPFKNVKRLYQACMNTALIEKRGFKPMTDILDKLGGWPMLNGSSWDESKWSLQETLINLKKIGYKTNCIFSFSVEIDRSNTSKSIIQIEQSKALINPENLSEGLNSEYAQNRLSLLVESAVLYGAERKAAENEMQNVLEFEFALAKISTEEQLYTLTIESFQMSYPYMNWLEYINAILQNVSQVTKDEIIYFKSLQFFNALGPLLKKTPKRTIANYIIWRVTKSSMICLTDEVRRNQLKYDKETASALDQLSRSEECFQVISSTLGVATGAMYVRKYFKYDTKVAALEMMESIREEFLKNLKLVPWMDDTTRSAALTKVKNMVHHIGYPDEFLNDDKLIDYYKTVSVDQDKYFESLLNVRKFIDFKLFKKLGDPINKTSWVKIDDITNANAYYVRYKNSIEIPASILQVPFFSTDRLHYLNYGALGFLIGHEITHGFDDEGIKFDSVGNKVNWWQNETKKIFHEKALCMIEQYGNYTEPSVNFTLNGKITLTENIADNGGCKIAYQAYQSFVAKNGPEQKLPGLKYTQNQLFWISGAQAWCAVEQPNNEGDRHAFKKFRVIGSFSNQEDFSKDFNCPLGSSMNPVKKCKVW